MPFEYICQHCGKSFLRRSRPSQKNAHRFCSLQCQRAPRAGLPKPDGTVLVPLTQGQVAVIDAEDAENILAYRWHFSGGYAWRKRQPEEAPGPSNIAMHCQLLDVDPGQVVDHIDFDGLNNRRGNLRPATRSQNVMHGRTHRDGMSGYRGVSWDRERQKWRVSIAANGRQHTIGRFDRLDDAVRARDEAAARLHGEFAWSNAESSEMAC